MKSRTESLEAMPSKKTLLESFVPFRSWTNERHHYVDVLEDYTDKRITFGFDIQTDDLVTGNFSFIPIAL